MLSARRSGCSAIAIAIGLMLAPTAQADELVDVESLQTHIEAAGELVEAPLETDWGVPDLPTSSPEVAADAPEVPVVLPGADIESRYHVEEPQYHAEYQPPQANPTPPPQPDAVQTAPQPLRVDGAVESAQVAAGEPAPTPAPTQTPAQPQPQATPTIWIWVWNWTWVTGSDERYHNLDDQYHIDTSILDKDVAQIVESIGVQMPVQIEIKNAGDIADGLLAETAPIETVAPAPVASAEGATRPSSGQTARSLSPKRAVQRRGGFERAAPAPLAVMSVEAESAMSPHVSGRAGKRPSTPQARPAGRPRAPLPVPSERLTDSAGASGGYSSSLLKTTVALALSLLLAAFGHGRRIWLPATRLRGLLGKRTDPPG